MPATCSRNLARRLRTLDEFLARVSGRLAGTWRINAREVVRSVFALLDRHVTPGQVGKVRDALPDEVRGLWPARGDQAA